MAVTCSVSGSSCSSSDFDALRPVVLSNDSPRKLGVTWADWMFVCLVSQPFRFWCLPLLLYVFVAFSALGSGMFGPLLSVTFSVLFAFVARSVWFALGALFPPLAAPDTKTDLCYINVDHYIFIGNLCYVFSSWLIIAPFCSFCFLCCS